MCLPNLLRVLRCVATKFTCDFSDAHRSNHECDWPPAAEFDKGKASGKGDGSGEERTSRRRKQLPEYAGRTFE
jgi:hypothetical protein